MLGLDKSRCDFVPSKDNNIRLDDEQEIVKDALQFRNGSFCLPLRKLFMSYLRIVWETLKMTPFLTVVTVMDTSGQIFLNLRGRTLELAGVGMFLLLHHMFVSILVYSGNEKLGIDLSNAFGGKSYNHCKEIFGKGIMTMAMAYSMFTLPIMFNIGHVMKFSGIQGDLPDEVQLISRQTTGMYTLQIVNALLQTFCMAQGHEQYFGLIGLINMCIALAGNYFLIYYLDFGRAGYAIVRTSAEVITLCMAIYVYAFHTQKETQGLASWSDTTKGFFAYFIESIKFTLGSYAYGLGIEIAGYFIALTQDPDQIGAYLCMLNFAGYLFTIAVAFSVICRTRINILIGMGAQKIARNYFGFFVFCIIVFSIQGTAILITTREYTATLFTSSSPKMQAWMEWLIICYAGMLSFEMSYHTSALGVKTVGKINILLIVAAILIIGVNILGCYGLRQFDATVTHFFIYSMCLCGCITTFAVYATMNYDWTKVQSTSEKLEQSRLIYEENADEHTVKEEIDKISVNPINSKELEHQDSRPRLNKKQLPKRFDIYENGTGQRD